jgi:hypothetical protein
MVLTLALQKWEGNYIGIISIPLLRSWCVNPTSHRNLGMSRFMIILTSCFTMDKALGWVTSQNAWGGD